MQKSQKLDFNREMGIKKRTLVVRLEILIIICIDIYEKERSYFSERTFILSTNLSSSVILILIFNGWVINEKSLYE